jgi:hypothetical protein
LILVYFLLFQDRLKKQQKRVKMKINRYFFKYCIYLVLTNSYFSQFIQRENLNRKTHFSLLLHAKSLYISPAVSLLSLLMECTLCTSSHYNPLLIITQSLILTIYVYIYNIIFCLFYLWKKDGNQNTVKSRAVDWSTIQFWTLLNSFGQRSRYISIKFPLHKQSANPWMHY